MSWLANPQTYRMVGYIQVPVTLARLSTIRGTRAGRFRSRFPPAQSATAGPMLPLPRVEAKARKGGGVKELDSGESPKRSQAVYWAQDLL